MLKSTLNLWWTPLLSLFLLGATSLVAQSQQTHDLTFGKTIDGYASTGGEGWIQNPGEVEIFRFEVAVPGQKIFLECVLFIGFVVNLIIFTTLRLIIIQKT